MAIATSFDERNGKLLKLYIFLEMCTLYPAAVTTRIYDTTAAFADDDAVRVGTRQDVSDYS